MKSYIVIIILMSVIVYCGTGCNSSTADETSKLTKPNPAAAKLPSISPAKLAQMKSQFRAEVLGADYSGFLSKCTYYPLYSDTGNAPADVQKIAKIIAMRVGNDIPQQNFSANECKRLGVQVLPNGSCFYTWELDTALVCFYMKHKTMPTGAEDYLSQYGCFSQANLTHCLNMSQEDRYCMLASIVNPSTGKLYSSFQSKTWVPFGINAEVVPKDQWKQVMPEIDHLRLGDPGSEGVAPGIMFHIVHYGERPGSIIENYVTCQP
jgi:hypothetical protein